jgi:tetratricopeptide (TPR) repeat protein
VEVHRWRGEVLLAQEDYAEAAAAFDTYLGKESKPPASAYRERGLARAKLGRHAEAVEDYNRALEAGPKEEERAALHLSRGQEYLAQSALLPALRDFEAARRLQPGDADTCLACAHVRVKLGDLGKGVADAEEALKADPKEPRPWHGAARVYAQAAAQAARADRGTEEERARLQSQYQRRAIALLRRALGLVPADRRREYWRDNVQKDKALAPIRNMPEFVQLAIRFGPPPP